MLVSSAVSTIGSDAMEGVFPILKNELHGKLFEKNYEEIEKSTSRHKKMISLALMFNEALRKKDDALLPQTCTSLYSKLMD